MSIIALLNKRTLKQIENDLLTSSVLALKRNDKIVTKKTAQSMRSESDLNKDGFDVSIYGSGGLKYIVEGKPANTKLPVKKTGNGFELLGSLKDWKAIRGFQGSDFILARAIAKNKREPVDVAGDTLEIFNKMFFTKTSSKILSLSASELGKQITKGI